MNIFLQLFMLLEVSLDFQNRIHEVSKYISKELGFKQEDIVLSIQAFYKRVNAGCLYEPNQTLRGKLLLVRAEENLYNLSESYGLNMVSEKPLK